jgi:hypothetical protein
MAMDRRGGGTREREVISIVSEMKTMVIDGEEYGGAGIFVLSE